MKLADLKGKTVAFAASGGLDSCTVTRWLTDHGVKVVCFTANLAQPDEPDINAIEQRMRSAGAVDFVLVDARNELAEAGLSVIQAQACYEGRYWNTTGIARYVTAEGILKEMRKRKIAIFSHGATGRGNDQVRFQLAAHMIAPDVQVYAPWRDEAFISTFGGRAQMIEYCEARGLPIRANKNAPYSTDANMLGLTHEAGKLEFLSTPASFVKPEMGVLPKDGSATPELVTIDFQNGRPIAINGKAGTPLDCILKANQIAGPHGVGICYHLVENRFVGIKSRGVYESPGMELLGKAYELVLQLVLDRRARELFDSLSLTIAKQIYQGFWYDTATQMALQAVNHCAHLVTGKVTIELFKGSINFVRVEDVPHSLYSEENASMEAVGAYNHGDAEGFLNVLAVSARVLAKSGQVQGL